MCDDDTGICNCDANQGYDGDKCDDCLVGWYWTASDSRVIRVSAAKGLTKEFWVDFSILRMVCQ